MKIHAFDIKLLISDKAQIFLFYLSLLHLITVFKIKIWDDTMARLLKVYTRYQQEKFCYSITLLQLSVCIY